MRVNDGDDPYGNNAFSSKNGELLWSYDTVRDFEAVNELEASGGAIDLGGVYLDGGQLFVSSGYGQMGQLPGNSFIVMDVQAEEQP